MNHSRFSAFDDGFPQPRRSRGRGRFTRNDLPGDRQNRSASAAECRPASANAHDSRPHSRSARPNVGNFTEKRFNWMLDFAQGPEKIKSAADARGFVQFILASESSVETLNRLTSSQFGLDVLKDALSLDVSLKFVKECVVPLIRFVGEDDRMTLASARGPMALKFIRTIYKAPCLFQPLVDFVIDRELSQEECVDVAWMTLQVIKGGDDYAIEAKNNYQVKRLAKVLSTGEFPAAKVVSDQINTLLDPVHDSKQAETDHFELVSTNRVQDAVPGWRHDNDKASFREILCYPTADELTCEKEPFLPRTEQVLEGSDRTVSSYLDWAFRLLRHDVVSTVKEELDVLLSTAKATAATRKVANRLKARSVNVTRFSRISCNHHQGVGFKMEFQDPFPVVHNSSNKNDGPTTNALKKEFWEKHPNFFKQQSVLAFVRRRASNYVELLGLGVVNVRDLAELTQSPSSIDVFFFNRADVERAVFELERPQTDLQAVQLSASLFAFTPILERLKMLASVPFEPELLHWTPSTTVEPPLYMNEAIRNVIEVVGNVTSPDTDLSSIIHLKKPLALDSSQKTAILNSLRRRVALIQGPPGTGKSYCGAIVAKIIHDLSNEVILCVCYTNHALDQFLEDLLDFGLPSNQLVRVGETKVSDRIKPFTLTSLLQSRSGGTLNKVLLHNLRRRLDTVEHEEIDLYRRDLAYLNTTERMEDFACNFDDEFAEAFLVSNRESNVVGEDGNRIGRDYLWKRWKNGDNSGVLVSKSGRVWSMTFNERLEVIEGWRRSMVESWAERLEKSVARFNEFSAELNEVNQQNELNVLKSKRIIGATTTGAAKFATKLDAVNAGVLLMEEAGEILEAHVVTAMSSNCQHLVMIGDHKQLRPKVNNYSLSVESGGLFGFNRSLFERLATKGFPQVALATQHRMRPEIADFSRQLAYPQLVDADSTKNRPNVNGTLSNIAFINHDQLEGDDKSFYLGDGNTLSKVNRHEVVMVSKIAEYFLRQGYTSNQLAVLTPYLAQLHAIREEMTKICQVILGELDAADLNRFGPQHDGSSNLPSTTDNQRSSVRVSTIDNFQGEEADIVIASLVRGNLEGSVGFVGQPERVNVLLSRARLGMFVVGNMQTFKDAKSKEAQRLWSKVLSIFTENQGIFSGFPAYCSTHDCRQLLVCGNDFEKLAGKSGCGCPCEVMQGC